MGRFYTVPFASGTVTNAGGDTDLWEVTPADDKPIRIRGVILGQTSEVADAAEEGLNMQIIHLPATVTSGNGSSVTPVPVDAGVNVAAGFTAEINGATVATTSGTASTVYEFSWNIRSSPLDLWFPERDMCPVARQASALVVRKSTTVADDITFSGTLIVEED